MTFLLAVLLAQDFPVELPLPAGLEAQTREPWVLLCDGKEVPVQVAGGKAVFLVGEKPGAHLLRNGTPRDFPKVQVQDQDGKYLLVSYGGRKILRYNYAPVPPPAGIDPIFERSGYLHPIWTPSGKVITHDSPKGHLHHHGLWGAWTSSEFEGRKSNFWESIEKQGRVECVKVEETFSGPVFGGFRARHRFVNLNGPGGPKTALEETWEVRVYAVADRFIFDLVSTQTCATAEPLVIREYRYGGIGFRGSGDWEGKAGCWFLTSEGRSRADGHATRARWCLMGGKVSGEDCAIAFLGSPSDFRYPQPMRIHPDEPFFNWAVPQGGDFSIEPGRPYVARYRFVVSDGRPTAESVESQWKAYAEPAVPLGK
ncbi:MAG TPA: PmoA family protein [Planctomycetota bacterium]|nr:PmoA family protein [Planctomycetota bacterium]